MSPIIAIHNLSKTYDSGLQALKAVNLEIKKGEIFALLGPNGAGKTTLIGIVCGMVRASGGSVTVGGHDIVSGYRGARAHDRSRAAGADRRRVRDRLGHGELHPRPVRQERRTGR